MAIEGKLKLADFYKKWPKCLKHSLFYSLIFEDLENAIEHMPGKWFSNKPNYKLWYQMDEYYLLIVDRYLIKLDIEDEDFLYSLRNIIIMKKISINDLCNNIDLTKI